MRSHTILLLISHTDYSKPSNRVLQAGYTSKIHIEIVEQCDTRFNARLLTAANGRLYRNSRTCVSCSVAASVASLAKPSSYLSKAVSRSSKFCSNAETSCLAAASTAATFCVMDLTSRECVVSKIGTVSLLTLPPSPFRFC
ncbi:hypothetical protein PUN28_017271 [Cardiocondyla obscurior]|uniref:Uncharacterized protein n=1 Tax=Cardiocondyla obscurior TaxID=286306 RepID=A0AAW2END3_9HYME